ncbi:uncharacterized protein LOC135951382 [Calliphora vicina]|uniref:uncharacterized protein LOC135951382 n=1 Tax=Calliphora vicina TaxID=7373 RepID=UPI00325ABF9F
MAKVKYLALIPPPCNKIIFKEAAKAFGLLHDDTVLESNLLKGGRTYHSQFILSVPLTETSTSSMRANTNDAQQIKKSKLIIWNEATMAHSHALNAVDKLLKIFTEKSKFFGGKVLLLGCDFRQCFPVVPHAHWVAVVQTSLKYSVLWSNFKILPLKTNMRAVDTTYRDWLLKMGNRELTSEFGEDIIEIPNEMMVQDSIVKSIFGENFNSSTVEKYSKSAIHCPRNDDVWQINEEVLNFLEGERSTYLSIDTVECDSIAERENYPVKFLNNLSPSGMMPHKLNLTFDAIMRNSKLFAKS